jgi:NADPH2:quinone reductase
VVRAPLGASFPEASTLLLNAVTARLSLDALALPRGSMVAVIGASGAVGGYATQLAKADGLTVLAVAASSDTALVRGLGADVIVEPGNNIADQVRQQFPFGVLGLIDGAAQDALALPAVADGGGLVTLKDGAGRASGESSSIPSLHSDRRPTRPCSIGFEARSRTASSRFG